MSQAHHHLCGWYSSLSQHSYMHGKVSGSSIPAIINMPYAQVYFRIIIPSEALEFRISLLWICVVIVLYASITINLGPLEGLVERGFDCTEILFCNFIGMPISEWNKVPISATNKTSGWMRKEVG